LELLDEVRSCSVRNVAMIHHAGVDRSFDQRVVVRAERSIDVCRGRKPGQQTHGGARLPS
jgi:hypothetical protein